MERVERVERVGGWGSEPGCLRATSLDLCSSWISIMRFSSTCQMQHVTLMFTIKMI